VGHCHDDVLLSFFTNMSDRAGPTFKYMEENAILPILAVSWRCQTMCVFLVPILIYQYYDPNIPQIKWTEVYPDLKYPYFYYIIAQTIAWPTNVICWVVGVKYTTTVRAALFASTHPVMLITALYLTVHRIQLMEWVGVAVIMCGIFYSFSNQLNNFKDIGNIPTTVNTGKQSTVFGDTLCLVSAFAEMVMVLFGSKATKYMSTMQVRVVLFVLMVSQTGF
jgi:drug/metabolite transporter (DMT)-like permease